MGAGCSMLWKNMMSNYSILCIHLMLLYSLKLFDISLKRGSR